MLARMTAAFVDDLNAAHVLDVIEKVQGQSAARIPGVVVWRTILGIAGIVLATPALVALKVVSEHAISGKALMEFLGPNKESPEPASRSKLSHTTSKTDPVDPGTVPNL